MLERQKQDWQAVMGQVKDGLETADSKCGREIKTVGWDETLRHLYHPI